MVRTNSTMLPLGTVLPSFDLPIVAGTNLEENDEIKSQTRINDQMLVNKPLLLMVICAHCPFVKHLEEGITNLDLEYSEKVQSIAISSNSLNTHPQDGPEYLFKQWKDNGWSFPYLFDNDQALAKSLKAACTPDFYLFAPKEAGLQKLQYRGQFDSSRPGNDHPITGEDLRTAIDAVLNSHEVDQDQKPSIGCNIKWEPGKEPEWFT